MDLAGFKIPGGTSLLQQRIDDLAAFPLRDTEAWHFQELAASFLEQFWSGGLAESVCCSGLFGSINGAPGLLKPFVSINSVFGLFKPFV